MPDSTPQPVSRAVAGFAINRVVVAALSGGLLAAPFFWNALIGEGPVICGSRRILGIPCPFCGLTRACCALARGELLRALELNVLCVPLAAFCVLALATAMLELWHRRPMNWYQPFISARAAKWLLISLGVFHLVRLALWLADGTLVNEYLKSGWLWQQF